MTLDNVKLIELPKILDERGNLSFFENNKHIPFTIARTYWIYDVPGGEVRGGHAYKDLQEIIIALSGSFDVVLDDGREKKNFTLNRSYFGVYVPKLIWRHMENFSTNSLALIVADKEYNADEYIRDYSLFVKTNADVGSTNCF
jgi:dTDP-4-dehydrorhamnose 3,5-epimerase-like enzyme